MIDFIKRQSRHWRGITWLESAAVCFYMYIHTVWLLDILLG